ncbi:MAG: hypothetical protein J8272_01915, partial ['Prunus persica' phytoplasma PP2]|nr:hypothetical protein ['Prunus persica' phytoplasma PP2]
MFKIQILNSQPQNPIHTIFFFFSFFFSFLFSLSFFSLFSLSFLFSSFSFLHFCRENAKSFRNSEILKF